MVSKLNFSNLITVVFLFLVPDEVVIDLVKKEIHKCEKEN